MTLPDLDRYGVIPPIWPGREGHSQDRAPYAVDILDFCQHFGRTSHRRRILDGLLRLRATLRALGIRRGFQWLNGSFAEDVERLQGRPPGDIDVVTFAELGSKEKQEARNVQFPNLQNNDWLKANYFVDHYCVQVDLPADLEIEWLLQRTTYWYSLWAHQRESLRWKGFASVRLEESDEEAAAWLRANALSQEQDS